MATSTHRPPYSSQPTSTTVISSSTASRSSVSRSSAGGLSTALTTPSLGPSPKLQGLVEVFEGQQSQPSQMGSPQLGLGIAHLNMEMSRSGTVKDRASRFEDQTVASGSNTPARAPSTSPLRIKTKSVTSQNPTPRKVSRVPVPRRTPPSGPRRASPGVKRGTGSARKMIQQWESGLGTPTTNVISAGRAGIGAGSGQKVVLSRDYLNAKPLPIPTPVTSTPQAQRARPDTYKLATPPRSAPSKTSYHLQTPQQQSRSPRTPLAASPSSSYSLNLSTSPSGNLRPKRKGGKSPLSERSPLKEILQVFGGGIVGRKVRGRSKGKDVSPSPSMDQLGSNGLPGGIVYRDRMGDSEMGGSITKATAWNTLQTAPASVVKASSIIYLVPTPCSSVSSWGSWLPSHAVLTATTLQVSYTPIFPSTRRGSAAANGSGSMTPRDTTPPPPSNFAKFPLPEEGQRPDVELAMKECVEVRSLRREEVKGRGVPRIPDMNGVEVLELLWEDGSKRYLGVDGVAGRLGWVSAIWDVLLACKSNIPLTLPPPSPQSNSPRKVSGLRHASGGASSLASFPFPAAPQPRTELSEFQLRIAHQEAKTAGASAQPVQKVGDMWVAASGALRIASGSGTVEGHQITEEQPGDLRDSVKRMFEDAQSQGSDLRDSWQPVSERELSIFSKAESKLSATSPQPTEPMGSPYSGLDYKRSSGTELSFDPNDLNPSRSASQVRRAPSTIVGTLRALGNGAPPMARVDEVSSRAPSMITRMTFPKPIVAGVIPRTATPSGSSSEETYLPTPRTFEATTAPSFDDTRLFSKMESHSQEHAAIATQVDGLHVNLDAVLASLAILAKQQVAEQNQPTRAIEDKLSSLQLDFRGVQDALQLNTLAAQREQAPSTDLVEVNTKLDAITRLCEDALARHSSATADVSSPSPSTSALIVSVEEEKKGGEEVANIMVPAGTDFSTTAGSSVVSELPSVAATEPARSGELSDQTVQQISEVLDLVKELQGARTVQTQQTTDIARYLSELNGWLEKFVKNGTTELSAMSTRLEQLTNHVAPAALMSEMHAMVSEQKRRNDSEGLVGQRLDALLQMMGEDKARHAQQQSAVDQVAALLERQRGESEMLLRALATDLTGEIRGERIRFVEAMQQATSVNVQLHIDEFKNLLSQEVNRAISELGEMREQKMALEHQISDLFALKAKHAPGQPVRSPARGQSPLPPAGSPRNLPIPSHH